MRELVIEAGDIFSVQADALLIAIDGTFSPRPGQSARLLGNIGAQLMRRFPAPDEQDDPEQEHWLLEEIEAQVDLPLELGQAALVELPVDAPFSYVALLSSLDHRGRLDASGKRGVVASAFAKALALCGAARVETVATTVLQGGWRLSQDDAATVMLRTVAASDTPYLRLIIRMPDDEAVDRCRAQAASLGLPLRASP